MSARDRREERPQASQCSPDAIQAILVLEQCEVFESLTRKTVQTLFELGKVRSLRKGDLLFPQGDDTSALHVVLSGSVRIEVVSSDGHRLAHRHLGPRETFGEISVLDGGPRTAAARALEASRVFSIERERCLSFLTDHPSCALALASLLARRIRATSHLLEDTLFLGACARVARMLVVLVHGHGRPLRGGHVIEVTHEELSQRTGLHRVSVTNQLQRLQEMELVEIDRGLVLVRDIARLEALSAG